ncbi:MAG: membrane fusion protein (multidrug efflux system) [Saprospiraceae bacterium]
MPDLATVKTKKPSLLLRLFLLLVFLAAIIAGLAYYKMKVQIPQLIAQGQAVPPPTNVTVAVAQEAIWNAQLKTIGSLVASKGINVSSEVAGVIQSIKFESGQEIARGDVLLTLGDEAETTALKSALASYKSANSQYQRSLKLKSQQFVTENDLDIQASTLSIAQAQIDAARVAIKKRTITAPFSGQLGIRRVDEGEYIAPGTNLVTLQSVDELYLDFTLPERNFNDLAVGQPLYFSVSSYPGTLFEGNIQAWDPSLDENTRTVSARALVNNKDRRLAPGMFAEINVQSANNVDVVTVPETAIFYNIYGEAVYVLEESEGREGGIEYILAAKQVKVLNRENDQAGIVSGLTAGEQVVTSGQLKLYPSLKVVATDDPPPYQKPTGSDVPESTSTSSIEY